MRFKSQITTQTENELKKITHQLKSPGKGIIDLSGAHDNKKFGEVQPPEAHRFQYLNKYLKVAKHLCFYINGFLVSEEMLEFEKARRIVLNLKEHNMYVGVKLKAKETEKPKVTDEGDGHEQNIQNIPYNILEICNNMKEMGVSLLMWSVCFHITCRLPDHQYTDLCMKLAKFAGICQLYGLVPLLSIELSVDMSINLADASEVLRDILADLVKYCHDFNVVIEGMILAMSSLPAEREKDCSKKFSSPFSLLQSKKCAPEEEKYKLMSLERRRAVATALAISQSVPPSIGLLMTNYSLSEMRENSMVLNAFNQCPVPNFPFNVGFCFEKVIEEGFDSKFSDHPVQFEFAKNELIKKAQVCCDASMGTLSTDEKTIFISNVTPI